jgi:hypothetical protein
MPKYKLLEKAFIDQRIYEAGDEVEFAGRPGPHMVPMDAEAKAIAKKLGLVNGPIPDPIDQITERVNEQVTEAGA